MSEHAGNPDLDPPLQLPQEVAGSQDVASSGVLHPAAADVTAVGARAPGNWVISGRRLSGVDQGQRAPGHMIKGMNPFSKPTQKSGGIRRSAGVAGLAGMILCERSCARDASASPFYGGRGLAELELCRGPTECRIRARPVPAARFSLTYANTPCSKTRWPELGNVPSHYFCGFSGLGLANLCEQWPSVPYLAGYRI